MQQVGRTTVQSAINLALGVAVIVFSLAIRAQNTNQTTGAADPCPQKTDGGQGVRRYSVSDESKWSNALNVVVTRTVSCDQYRFRVDFVVPSTPASLPEGAAIPHPNLVSVYGFQITDTGRTDLPKESFPVFHGDWKIGDPVQLEFDVPKQFSDRMQGWDLRFCVGTVSRCIPSPNLLEESAPAPTHRGDSSHIRVENRSGIDFRNVIVNRKEFGDIKAGAVSNYQVLQHAYRYGRISLSTDSGPLGLTPIDYFGERRLGDGKFTYVLTIQDGKLRMECVVD